MAGLFKKWQLLLLLDPQGLGGTEEEVTWRSQNSGHPSKCLGWDGKVGRAGGLGHQSPMPLGHVEGEIRPSTLQGIVPLKMKVSPNWLNATSSPGSTLPPPYPKCSRHSWISTAKSWCRILCSEGPFGLTAQTLGTPDLFNTQEQ